MLGLIGLVLSLLLLMTLAYRGASVIVLVAPALAMLAAGFSILGHSGSIHIQDWRTRAEAVWPRGGWEDSEEGGRGTARGVAEDPHPLDYSRLLSATADLRPGAAGWDRVATRMHEFKPAA